MQHTVFDAGRHASESDLKCVVIAELRYGVQDPDHLQIDERHGAECLGLQISLKMLLSRQLHGFKCSRQKVIGTQRVITAAPH